MVDLNENQAASERFNSSRRGTGSPFARRPFRFQVAALALFLASLLAAGWFMFGWFRSDRGPEAAGEPQAGSKAPPRLFHGWPQDRKPDVALVLSGEVQGYLQPCGCSEPQYGGLERRYNFFQYLLKDRGWPVVAVDLGDIAPPPGPQALLRYRYSMEGLHGMGYTAVGVGPNEMGLPLIDALSEYTLNNPSPRVVVANLLERDKKFPGMVGSWEMSGPRVAVAGAVAPSIAQQAKQKDAELAFAELDRVLPAVQREMEDKHALVRVLLLQGTFAEAKEVAKNYPGFHVIQCRTHEEEPPGTPETVGDTLVIGVGHKGRYVGVVGVYRANRANSPLELRYQLVSLDPEYKTPPGSDAENPMLALLEKYSKEVRDKNYLKLFAGVKSDHPIQAQPEFRTATYVGSARCQKCHPTSYQIWKDSPHSRAYDSLVKATRPDLRQFDGECLVCHTTGFAYTGGFTDAVATPQFKDNGCENCHGPASLHIENPNNRKLRALMNPFKTRAKETPAEKMARINRLDASCQKCHDIDNDVHWSIEKWTSKHIVHKEP